jgi:hypothetical protein
MARKTKKDVHKLSFAAHFLAQKLYFWKNNRSCFMKYFPLIIILFLFLLSGCDEKKETDAKDFNKNLKSFNKSINRLDKTMDVIDKMDEEMSKVERMKNSGAITENEAFKREDIIRKKYTRELSEISSENKTPVVLPAWAVRLGLTLPENMKADETLSQATSQGDEAEGYNSFTFVFRGDYNIAMRQAKKIAALARIPEGKDYREAKKLSEQLDIEPLKGAVYMNFEIGKEDDIRYHIAITVDESGVLTISATDMKQLMSLQDFSNN